MTPVLFGSRAHAARSPEARAPRDWDVIARAEDVAYLGPPARTWPNRLAYDLPTSYLEIVLADEMPWATLLLELTTDELVVDVPLVGPARVADLTALFVLKTAHAVYPVSFYKSLADYHFLRPRIGPLPRTHHALLGLAADTARTRYAESLTPRSESCATGLSTVRDWTAHAELHARHGTTTLEPGWALVPPDASTLGRDRAQAIRRIAEEAMVLAIELRGSPAHFRWALRVLATRFLPLPWRYFVVDAWPEITPPTT